MVVKLVVVLLIEVASLIILADCIPIYRRAVSNHRAEFPYHNHGLCRQSIVPYRFGHLPNDTEEKAKNKC